MDTSISFKEHFINTNTYLEQNTEWHCSWKQSDNLNPAKTKIIWTKTWKIILRYHFKHFLTFQGHAILFQPMVEVFCMKYFSKNKSVYWYRNFISILEMKFFYQIINIPIEISRSLFHLWHILLDCQIILPKWKISAKKKSAIHTAFHCYFQTLHPKNTHKKPWELIFHYVLKKTL